MNILSLFHELFINITIMTHVKKGYLILVATILLNFKPVRRNWLCAAIINWWIKRQAMAKRRHSSLYLEQPGVVKKGLLLTGLRYWFLAAVPLFVHVLHQQTPHPCRPSPPLLQSSTFCKFHWHAFLWQAPLLAWSFLHLPTCTENLITGILQKGTTVELIYRWSTV